MPLTLDSNDLLGVQRIIRILLSPLDFPALDDWRREICHQAKHLLGADLATFQLPNAEASLFFSDELEQSVITSYPDRIDPLDRRFNVWERKATLGVCDRAAIWGAHLEEYQRGTYFQEFVVPARGFDAIILASALDPQRITPSTMATLMFHHASPRGSRFGSRGLDLLRLLQPAFETGVRSYRSFRRRHASFVQMLDTFEAGVMLMSADGRVIHENPALARMLAMEAEFGTISLRDQLKFNGRCLAGSSSGEPITAPAAREIRTTRHRYTIRASLIHEGIPGDRSGIMVTLERLTRELPSTSELRERFGLTAQEATIALLLGQGKDNGEIARELVISPHTARRHTERILQKMDVRSRSEVGAKLLL
jgi:DNA-binding CsgD family transcriptional regulator